MNCNPLYLTRPEGSFPCLLLTLLMLISPPLKAQDHRLLSLDEVAAYALPDSFPVKGVAVSAEGSVAVWSTNHPFVLVGDRSTFVEVGDAELVRPVGARFTNNDEVVEVLDSAREAVLTYMSGQLTDVRQFSIPATIISAEYSPGSGWILAATDASGTRSLYLIQGNSGKGIGMDAIKLGLTGLDKVFLDANGMTGVLVTQAEDPFSVSVLDTAGKRYLSFNPPLSKMIGYTLAAGTPKWLALGTVALPNHFIQTIADLRSDRRILFLYNKQGELIRSSEIDLPLGFIGIMPESQTLIALRGIRGQEIVRYRWRWSEKPFQKEDES